MSISGASDKGTRATDSAHVTESSTPVSPSAKVQTAWKSVRSNFKAKASMPDLKRWLSYPRASESNSNSQGEERHPEDEEQSLFCQSLLALMQRTGRFDYLDYGKSTTEQEEESIESAQKEKENEKRRPLKRFSWSR